MYGGRRDPAETGRMTYDDVIVRTAAMFAVIVVTGAATWCSPQAVLVRPRGRLVRGLVNAFKKTPSPALIMAYAAFEGVFLGGISAFFEAAWQGIVMQAILATVATFAACLFLFRSGRVRDAGLRAGSSSR